MSTTPPSNTWTGSAYRTADMSWQEMRGFPSGVEVKILRMDFRSGAKTMLVKMPAGGQILAHHHDSAVQHFIVEGGYETAGQVFNTGTYRLIPKDTDIPEIDSKNGVTFLLISDPLCAIPNTEPNQP
jgi:anti-sigma factor ChrR (cupin superfamily)